METWYLIGGGLAAIVLAIVGIARHIGYRREQRLIHRRLAELIQGPTRP